LTAGEQWAAAFSVPGSGDGLAFKEANQIPMPAIKNGRLQISPDL
jgi:hypothetical protein